MADLNALIAQGYQYQPPSDPFVQYGRMQQLEQGQQTNQLNRMKMQKAERSMEETNALRRLDPASATYLQDVTRLNPKLGFEFAKSQREAKTADTEGQIKSTKLVADKLALLPDAYRMADTPEAYLAVHKSVHADPVLGPYLQSLGATPEKGIAQLNDAVQTGKFDQFRMRSMQSVSQLLDSIKPVVVGASSSVYDPTKGTFSQAPAAPEKTPTSADATTMQALGYPLTTEGFAAFNDAKRQDRLLNPAELAQKLQIAAAGRAPTPAKDDPNTTAAFREVDNAGNVTFYNKFGLPISTQKGAGKPSATFEKTKQGKAQLVKDLDQAIVELTDVTKDGGLIDQSTGSGVGRAVDIGARFIGKATPGDIAIGKLQPIADLSLKMIPRFEGPQSNADTTSYKQAAGQLADPTLPPEIRKEAGKTVLRLMKSRKDQFTMVDTAPAATGVDASNPLLK